MLYWAAKPPFVLTESGALRHTRVSADPSQGGCTKGDYNNQTVMAAAKSDWHRVFSSMPRVDSLFINAGDPGGQDPDDLLMLSQVARGILKQCVQYFGV